MGRVRAVPAMGKVFAGMGTVWENPTCGLPVLNPKWDCWQPPQELGAIFVKVEQLQTIIALTTMHKHSKPLSLQVPLKSHHRIQYKYISQMSSIIMPLPPTPSQCLIILFSIGNWRPKLLLYVRRTLLLMLALDVERP